MNFLNSMTPKKCKIFCKKYVDLNKKSSRKYKAKDHDPQMPCKLRAPSLKKESSVQICFIRNKRLRTSSPECRVSREPSYGSKEPVTRTGILKKKISCVDVEENYSNSTANGDFIAEPENLKSSSTASTRVFDERKRTKKIRFKIPEGTLGYEDARKAMWRSQRRVKNDGDLDQIMRVKAVPTRYPTVYRKHSLSSPSESIKDIMPVLERIKNDDGIIESELSLRTIYQYLEGENKKRKRRSRSGKGRRIESDDELEESENDSNDFYHIKFRLKCCRNCSK